MTTQIQMMYSTIDIDVAIQNQRNCLKQEEQCVSGSSFPSVMTDLGSIGPPVVRH